MDSIYLYVELFKQRVNFWYYVIYRIQHNNSKFINMLSIKKENTESNLFNNIVIRSFLDLYFDCESYSIMNFIFNDWFHKIYYILYLLYWQNDEKCELKQFCLWILWIHDTSYLYLTSNNLLINLSENIDARFHVQREFWRFLDFTATSLEYINRNLAFGIKFNWIALVFCCCCCC